MSHSTAKGKKNYLKIIYLKKTQLLICYPVIPTTWAVGETLVVWRDLEWLGETLRLFPSFPRVNSQGRCCLDYNIPHPQETPGPSSKS